MSVNPVENVLLRIPLPQVMDDGSLIFDSRMTPKSLPMFRKEGDRFYPNFVPCKYRIISERPLTPMPG